METNCTQITFILLAGLLFLPSELLAQMPDGPAFTPLFNGHDLAGWEGDKRFWQVADGAIVGETTTSNKAEKNTFLVYRSQEFGDFDLRFEYQVTEFNSGIQYRSVVSDGFVVKGYQADFEAPWHDTGSGKIDKFTGMFFDEGGRMFMGQRGQVVIVRSNPENPKKPFIEPIASVGNPVELEKVINRNDWNKYRVLAKGFQFTHIINGRVMAVGIDDDEANRRATGVIALQLHAGRPMQIRVRNIEIR